MWSTAQSYRNTPRPNSVVTPISVDQDLSLKHDYGLVHVWVSVKRGRLAPRHRVLPQRERPVSLLRGGLHGPQTSASKPEALAFCLPSDDRPCRAYCLLLLPPPLAPLALNGTTIPQWILKFDRENMIP